MLLWCLLSEEVMILKVRWTQYKQINYWLYIISLEYDKDYIKIYLTIRTNYQMTSWYKICSKNPSFNRDMAVIWKREGEEERIRLVFSVYIYIYIYIYNWNGICLSICLPAFFRKQHHVKTTWRNFIRFRKCHMTNNVLPQNIDPERYYFRIYHEYIMHWNTAIC